MRTTILFLVALLLSGSALASDKTDVMAPVNQFADAFNKGDMKAAAAVCTPSLVIIDEFAPHVWQGTNAFADWGNDFEKDAKANGITDPVVKILKFVSVDVTGDRAYVVTRVSYDWKQKGKAMREKGSFLTIGLQKVAAGWRISGWSWTKL
jgi:ketosteroid isomerase-like protein